MVQHNVRTYKRIKVNANKIENNKLFAGRITDRVPKNYIFYLFKYLIQTRKMYKYLNLCRFQIKPGTQYIS